MSEGVLTYKVSELLGLAKPAGVSLVTYLAWSFLLGHDDLICVGAQLVLTEY